ECSTKKTVLLNDQLISRGGRTVDRNHCSRRGCGKTNLRLPPATIGTLSHEKRLARKDATAGGKQFVKNTLIGIRPVTHFGFKRNSVFHEQHSSCFRNDSFGRIEFYFNNLNALSFDLVVYFV